MLGLVAKSKGSECASYKKLIVGPHLVSAACLTQKFFGKEGWMLDFD